MEFSMIDKLLIVAQKVFCDCDEYFLIYFGVLYMDFSCC